MIDVEQITVNVRIPSTEVRVVAMQPFIKLRSSTEEPFRWSDDAVGGQLAAIRRTLDIALGGFGGPVANFTLFPEYAIPGIEGVSVINERISAREWPNESIIIAGVHGIRKDEYKRLCDELTAQVSLANAPDSVPDDKWVNCCVIWVKDRDGLVKNWVQPKVRPAWTEIAVACNDMFCGSKVYVFECKYDPTAYPCRFITLICFDWVASVAGTTVCNELLEKLSVLWSDSPRPLHWVFVIQHNPGPNKPSFLYSTYRFLTDASAYPFVERDKAIVVHANTALSPHPARSGRGGYSSCIFSPSAPFDSDVCRPTVCMQPSSLRASDILKRCIDVVFREMGECIHAFTVRVPRFVTSDATDRTFPLPSANVHAVHESTDPRLCGKSVPAAVKWVNDSLDVVERLSATDLAFCPLKMNAETVEPAIIDAMRPSDGHAASDSVNWAACSFSNGDVLRDERRSLNADLWEVYEADSIKHVLHSLTSLRLAYHLEVKSAVLHCEVQSGERFVQVVAIRGNTYQDCRHHFDEKVRKQGSDPILVILRDRSNLTPTPEEFLRLDEIGGDRGVAFLDYQTLITKCRISADSIILKGKLDGFLPRNSRIV